MDDMKKLIDEGNKEFIRKFIIEAVLCEELSKLQGDRIMQNDKLKHFFPEEKDGQIETMEETERELHNLKQKIRGDGLEYLLCENIDTSDGSEGYIMECNECNRIWDGNAQCPCGLNESA